MTVNAWSKSSLSTLLEGCAWQWALTKRYGYTDPGSPATVLGTAYHAGVEAWLRRRLLRQRDGLDLPDLDLDGMVEAGQSLLDVEAGKLPGEQWALHRTDVETLHGQLAVALKHWWSTPIPAGQPGAGGSLRDRIDGWRILAVEPYFRVRAPGVEGQPIHGYIDLLAYDPDDDLWMVVDHKTAGTFGRWPADGVGHELEAAVYDVGATVARHLPTFGKVAMEWHVARREPGSNARFEGVRVVQRVVDQYDRLWMGDRIVQADRQVESGEFPTNPGWNLCSAKWCAFHRGCQVTGELHPDVLSRAANLTAVGGPSN